MEASLPSKQSQYKRQISLQQVVLFLLVAKEPTDLENPFKKSIYHFNFSENYSGSVYRGHFQSTTLTPLLPAPLLFLLQVAPSILQNAVRRASRLLQLLHFTCWLVGLSTPIPCSFPNKPPLAHLCFGEPDNCGL